VKVSCAAQKPDRFLPFGRRWCSWAPIVRSARRKDCRVLAIYSGLVPPDAPSTVQEWSPQPTIVHALFEVCNDRLAVPARVRPEHTAIATAASPTPRLFRSITSEGQHCLFDRSSGSPTARIWRRQAPLALERPLPNSRPSNGRSSMSALLPYRSLSRSPSCRLDVSNWPSGADRFSPTNGRCMPGCRPSGSDGSALRPR
jgi:hypothetical protein